MAKLFKNGKSVLSFVIAFAVIAVALFTASVNINTDALCDGRIEYWDGTFDQSLTGAGTEANPYLITNAAELNYVCTVASDTNTVGKYYKVDPGIKAFILQPQATVTALGGDDAFMNISSAEAVKTLFETTAPAAGVEVKNWYANCNRSGIVFDGDFDGSSVEIYGLYCNTPIRGIENCGLFPAVDGGGDSDTSSVETDDVGITIENLAIRNSYFKGYRRVGALTGTAWYQGGGTLKVNGIVNINDCEVTNCFLVGQDLVEKDNTITPSNPNERNAEMAVLCGSMGNDPAKVTRCFIAGNATEYRDYDDNTKTTYVVDETRAFNRVFAQNGKANNVDSIYGFLKDSIVLGAQVSALANNTDSAYCSNVYSDIDSAVNNVTKLESADIAYTAEGQALMNGLNWDTDWFMSERGPVLRRLHGTIRFIKAHSAHYYECADCGLKSVGGAVAHTWNDSVCTECGYECHHNGAGDQVLDQFQPATCVTPAGVYSYCNNCDWELVVPQGVANGHQLTWVDEVPANCQSTGVKGYWHCTECGGNYVGETEEEAKWAAMDSSITDPQVSLVIPIAPHNAHDLENGTILVRSDETGHWYLCYTCDGRLEAVVSDELAPEDKVVKHRFADSVCTECGWKCEEHDYVPTGNVLTVGSCTEDRVEEVKCKICGNKDSLTTPAKHEIIYCAEVAATDKLEGTKAHYECSVCKEIYADAAGTTKISKAELVIPKVLPAGYENTVIGGGNGNINTDTGNKSPATGENIALAVLSIVALSGVVFVITRKARKA